MTEQVSQANAGQHSTSELVEQLSEQVTRLARDELKLAQAEMTRKGLGLAKGAGLLGGSTVILLYGLGCLLAAAIAGIATVLATWLAALIVGAALLLIAGIVALAGKRKVTTSTPPVPSEMVESVKADAETIKESAHR